jgi:hypothetical protein
MKPLVGVADIAENIMVNCELKLARGSRLVWSDGNAFSRRKEFQDFSKNQFSIYVKTVDSCWHFFIADGFMRRLGKARALESTPTPRAEPLLTSRPEEQPHYLYPSCEVFQQRKFPLPAQ